MEEIDTIIIDSLRNLHCDIDEDITSLKHFDADLTVSAISRCLEAIIPDTTFPKKLSPSMSAKLKITSSLASQIKDLGFRDDIGYQTILYCNEAEIRRVLMFLIEKLPREPSKVAHVEQTGYVPSLVKKIEQRVRESLGQFWVPSSVLPNGFAGQNCLSLGGCRALRSQKLQVPCVSDNSNEALKEYWIRNAPVVTKQTDNLIPSLLFQDLAISSNDENLRKCLKLVPEAPSRSLLNKLVQNEEVTESEDVEFDTKLQNLVEILKAKNEECQALQSSVRSFESQRAQADRNKHVEEENLEKILAEVNLKSKTLTVLSKEENFQKLKNMIEASKSKLVKMAEQWEKIQSPLLEEYKTLQKALSSEDLKKQQEREKLRKLEETYKALSIDLGEKAQMEEQLRLKLAQISKGNSRSGYTRRILEIIGNVRKQDEEIQKILKDTREVQREISSLTGQVDRSFTLADELIFRDARTDETARKAYKLLAQLRDDCSSIIKGVTDLGAVERECRNLQEQIDSETAKESAVKLQRVLKDLQDIRKENETLRKS